MSLESSCGDRSSPSLSPCASSAVTQALGVLQACRFLTFPGGTLAESSYIDGLLVRKSLARKTERSVIASPRLLLIAASMHYASPGKVVATSLASLDDMAHLEREYMHILVAKIMTAQPDVLMLSGSIHRTAEELLVKHHVVRPRGFFSRGCGERTW